MIGFPIIGCVWTFIVKYLSSADQWNFYVFGIIGGFGVLLGCLSYLSKSFGNGTWKTWRIFILFIDKIIIWTLMPVFFYTLFSPYAYLLRLLGKLGLKKLNPNRKTYWEDVDHPDSIKRYLQQF
tara:strand:- start:2563 stop:2934 length:372 start_codon:yes stop_codon:yes gene_type:complete